VTAQASITPPNLEVATRQGDTGGSREPYPVPSEHDDSRYTDGSSLADRAAHIYIEELASDICHKLHLRTNRREWDAISAQVPLLLKAFAIRIGHSADTPMLRGVMKFVYKHRRQV